MQNHPLGQDFQRGLIEHDIATHLRLELFPNLGHFRNGCAHTFTDLVNSLHFQFRVDFLMQRMRPLQGIFRFWQSEFIQKCIVGIFTVTARQDRAQRRNHTVYCLAQRGVFFHVLGGSVNNRPECGPPQPDIHLLVQDAHFHKTPVIQK